MDGGDEMSEVMMPGRGGSKIYTEEDCVLGSTASTGGSYGFRTITFPAGITWGDIRFMMVQQYDRTSEYFDTYRKAPDSTELQYLYSYGIEFEWKNLPTPGDAESMITLTYQNVRPAFTKNAIILIV